MSGTYQDETIWIIGASSGIGRALALLLAAQGATLVLSARRTAELEQLAAELGGTHSILPFDVADAAATASAVGDIYSRHPHLDRIVFLAGIYTPMTATALDLAEAQQIMQVNFGGALNLVHALWPKLVAQSFGQLAICASVVGYIGLPKGQPYNASKAALINFTESLYLESPPHVDVKLICPGFVRTDLMAKHDATVPFMISPERAAQAIAEGLPTRRFEIHFPKRLTWVMKWIRLLPYPLSLWMLGGL